MIYTNCHTPLLRDSPPGAIALGTAARADVLSGGGSRASRAPDDRSVRGIAPCVISEREGLRKTVSFQSAKDCGKDCANRARTGFDPRPPDYAPERITTALRSRLGTEPSATTGTYTLNCFNAVRDLHAALAGQDLCAVTSTPDVSGTVFSVSEHGACSARTAPALRDNTAMHK